MRLPQVLLARGQCPRGSRQRFAERLPSSHAEGLRLRAKAGCSPAESKYEVVAGARRLRAAKLAELEKLPVRVVKLTDAEAIEAQCVENLQREDIHPLEEALGFKSLLELGEPAYTIATIA